MVLIKIISKGVEKLLSTMTGIVVAAAVILWALIAVVFVAAKIRNLMQHRKYSVKTEGDVATEYKCRGLK